MLRCSNAIRRSTIEPAVKNPAPRHTCSAYLRMVETRGRGLPPSFVSALQFALAHYGVRTLERCAKLEESLLCIYKSHQRVEQQIAPVVGILERRLRHRQALSSVAAESLRTLLDRMASSDQRTLPRSHGPGERSALSLLRPTFV
jgi:hypothetical protein